MKFCVIRHPDVEVLGTCPQSALEHHRSAGWVRISDWRDEAADFHLPDYTDAHADLDAPTQAQQPAEPAADEQAPRKTKEKQA